MKSKVICLVLVLLMLISIMPVSAFAVQTKCERPLQFEENIAAGLKKLTLFKGVSDTDFALERVPSRIEALVIMLRLMGKEAEILAGEYKHPFSDVPAWADKYVGYAFENKLTNGISATKFGVGNATDTQFITFVLRAMNYSDANGDFAWDNPYELAEKLGILTCAVTKGAGFLRADCVTVSFNALFAKLKDSTKTLADKLIDDKVFTTTDYKAAVGAVPDYAGIIKAYGLKWHETPVTQDDHIDNLCYCFATGNWEWTHDAKGELNLPQIVDIKVELAGFILNQPHTFCYKNGRYYICIDQTATSPLSPEDISMQIVKAYEAAKKIYDEMHAKGKVTSSMTQKQIAEAYSNYLQSYGAETPWYFKGDNFPENYDDPSVKILYMTEDTAYGCLVKKQGACGSKAAAYNLVMNIEGIKTIGLHVEGHIVSYLLVDGEEYMCDWGNRVGLFTEDDVINSRRGIRIIFDTARLEFVRNYYQNGAPTKIMYQPEFSYKLIKETGTEKTYYVKMISCDSSIKDSYNVLLLYGRQGNGTGSYYSVKALKQGVYFTINKDSIIKHNLVENFFIDLSSIDK